jgi:SAM-dependent methyltransferase
MYSFDLERNKNAYEHFWYRARRSWLRVLLRKYSVFGRRVLEVGCGGGSQLGVLAEHNRAVGCDNDELGLAAARARRNDVFACDLTAAIPEGGPYDVVAAFDVLEHIADDDLALENIRGALRDGGHLLVAVPAFQALFSGHDRLVGHVRRYERAQLKALLERHGFAVVELNFWNSVLFLPVAAVRLLTRHRDAHDATPPQRPLINEALYGVLCLDNLAMLLNWRAPWGLSLYAVAIKKARP